MKMTQILKNILIIVIVMIRILYQLIFILIQNQIYMKNVLKAVNLVMVAVIRLIIIAHHARKIIFLNLELKILEIVLLSATIIITIL